MDIERIELIGGHPALDFVNSVEGRGSDTALNYLPDFETLARWFELAGLITPQRREALFRRARSDPQGATRVWRDAMKLRESLDRIFRALANRERPPVHALAAFNEALQLSLANRQVVPDDSGTLRWTWRAGLDPLDSLLNEIALAAVDLMTDEKAKGRIKVCANGPCDWMFLDTSKNGQRKWCRMAVCGNVTKVRKFRARQRSKS